MHGPMNIKFASVWPFKFVLHRQKKCLKYFNKLLKIVKKKVFSKHEHAQNSLF
jgi:hypothetical protein